MTGSRIPALKPSHHLKRLMSSTGCAFRLDTSEIPYREAEYTLVVYFREAKVQFNPHKCSLP